jgi:hypothetical protein
MVCFFLDSNVQYRRSKSFFLHEYFRLPLFHIHKLQACILWSIFLKIYLCHFFIPFRQSARRNPFGRCLSSQKFKYSFGAFNSRTKRIITFITNFSRQFNKLRCIFFLFILKKLFHCFLEVVWCYFLAF